MIYNENGIIIDTSENIFNLLHKRTPLDSLEESLSGVINFNYFNKLFIFGFIYFLSIFFKYIETINTNSSSSNE